MYGIVGSFEGQTDRLDLEACLSSGLVDFMVEVIEAFASAGARGLQDANHSTIVVMYT